MDTAISAGHKMNFLTKLKEIEDRLGDDLPSYESELHGISHLRQVALLAGQIADEMGEDVEAAMVAGILHDCGRVDDAGGSQHAIDSAKLAEPLLKRFFPHLDAERILSAISLHADGLVTEDILAGALWDADRLTLTRCGKKVKLEMLSTEPGKIMAKEIA
jgi:putative nucleotidyltransferase with HDIG domain